MTLASFLSSLRTDSSLAMSKKRGDYQNQHVQQRPAQNTQKGKISMIAPAVGLGKLTLYN